MNIAINKNRGWRGLAEAVITEDGKVNRKMTFSFSPDTWNDLLKGVIVLQDDVNFYIYTFNNLDRLPKQTQQRSVLIKDFFAEITNEQIVPKDKWLTTPYMALHSYICHFKYNKNNHTTSDWNCVGMRVTPKII